MFKLRKYLLIFVNSKPISNFIPATCFKKLKWGQILGKIKTTKAVFWTTSQIIGLLVNSQYKIGILKMMTVLQGKVGTGLPLCEGKCGQTVQQLKNKASQ